MRRISISPRPNWESRVEDLGFYYHTIDGEPYWDESACYEFSLAEIEELEAATQALHELCLDAVQAVFDQDRLDEFQIPPEFQDWVRDSWDNDQPALFGRFDLAWDGRGSPKLLEYNADTPTSLFEAAVVQWQWLEELYPELDQLNSLHEQLIETWQHLRNTGMSRVCFSAVSDQLEDLGNVAYLRHTAAEAGIDTDYLNVDSVGYNAQSRAFVDLQDRRIDWLFKLYPWEWMIREEFGRHLPTATTRWIEPPWKMLLSNKAILVVLWELFPDCPYLLPASWEPIAGDHVRKPALAREGSNIGVFHQGRAVHSNAGPYGNQPVVYQTYSPLAESHGNYAVLGSWIVGGVSCGLGIREDHNPITHNLSRFVPHLIRG